MPILPVGTSDPVVGSSWVTGESIAGDPRLVDANMPADVTYDMCAMGATEFLYKRSGRRFRVHSVILRPNEASCGCWGASAELDLPGPVFEDTLVVTIDGVVLSSSSYRLYDRHLLVRTDGLGWPTCVHLSSFTDYDWSIALDYGESPGMDGILACRELAIHTALACSGKISKIPARATTLSRNGLSINLMRGKRTGIALVDDFLDSENPERLMARPSVMSPDTVRLSRTDEALGGYLGGGY